MPYTTHAREKIPGEKRRKKGAEPASRLGRKGFEEEKRDVKRRDKNSKRGSITWQSVAKSAFTGFSS